MMGALYPLFASHLESIASRSSGRLTPDVIVATVAKQEFYAWVAMDGETKEIMALVLTQLMTAPTGLRWASIVAATGVDRKRWRDELLAKIEAWAKENDCAMIEAVARPGWERELVNYRKTHVMLERAL